MHFFSRIVQPIAKLFRKVRREAEPTTLDEAQTQPLDMKTLAKALDGESRRHVSIGSAKVESMDKTPAHHAHFVLVGNSDGLNVLPDFAIFGIAESQGDHAQNDPATEIAMSTFAHVMLDKVIMELLEIEVGGEGLALTEAVDSAFSTAAEALSAQAPNVEVSMTAGLMYADLLIFGHTAESQAYLIDHHRYERITNPQTGKHRPNDEGPQRIDRSQKLEKDEPAQPRTDAEALFNAEIFTQPVPRDGFVFLCSGGILAEMSKSDIRKMILDNQGPQHFCDRFAATIANRDSHRGAALVLLYFPPDFDSWR